MQFLLLLVLWMIFLSVQNEAFVQRLLGVAASLFVILIIPEFWKNRMYHSIEIEAVSYYSLRQIYAARMLLFGMADFMLVTLFCGLVSFTLKLVFSQLLVQFIFPMLVTTCICFGILCSRHAFSEVTAVASCAAWSSVWTILILNERIYCAITFPLWLCFLLAALLFFCFAVWRVLSCCSDYWEVNSNGIEIG